MRRLSLAGAMLLAVFPSTTACELVGVRGSGDVISESRSVSGFTQVMFKGSGRVSVEVTGEESLTIEAEENLMPLLTSEVENGVLVLGSNEAISPTQDIVYTITVDRLDGVTIQGSGELSAPDVETSAFEAIASGSGELFLPNLTTQELVVRISGSGDAQVSGSASHLELDVSGSGSYLGQDLVAMTANVDNSGSGDATVNVRDNLKATLSGSGSIIYFGEPASVDSSVSGSGEIEEG